MLRKLLSTPMGVAAIMIAVSGLLHFLPVILGSAGPSTPSLVVIGLLCMAMAEGLRRNWRWLAFLVYPMVLMGAVLAFSRTDGGAADRILWLMVLADLACAVSLFLALWPTKRPLATS